VRASDADFHQLAAERFITLTGPSISGQPTQSGIEAAAFLKGRAASNDGPVGLDESALGSPATEFAGASKEIKMPDHSVASSDDKGQVRALRGLPQCDPRLWRYFVHEKSKTSKYRDLLIHSLNISAPKNRSHRNVVERIAMVGHIPVESLCEELSHHVFSRGQTISGSVGDEFDQIAGNCVFRRCE
jgi:hypothetical protein